ncbi:MAG TPA: hypothetical protein PLH23_04950 [Hyphomonadaceae bacterium]|nr:hypothetical protein [Hyphomonadaceae bacterium]HPI47594.1 hypothetical protein [Hyphomonadaceae bacterium]
MRRKTSLQALGVILKKSPAMVGRYCHPRNHADYSPPPRDVEARLLEWSGGKITFANHADLWTAEAEAALGGFEPVDAAPAAVPEDVQ